MNAKRILVPTDFSPSSQSALQLAISLANNNRSASVLLLHVIEPTVPRYDEKLGVLEPEALKTELEVLTASRDQNVNIDAMVRYGAPAKRILEVAEEEKADLIVMGMHGQRGLVKLLTGGTAAAVLRNAGCPVLTVRDDSTLLSAQEDSERLASTSERKS